MEAGAWVAAETLVSEEAGAAEMSKVRTQIQPSIPDTKACVLEQRILGLQNGRGAEMSLQPFIGEAARL